MRSDCYLELNNSVKAALNYVLNLIQQNNSAWESERDEEWSTE